MEIIRLVSGGYEAHIMPQMGASCTYFANKELNVCAFKAEALIENTEDKELFFFGMPMLFPPNRISGAKFTFEGREYAFPVAEDTGCSLHGAIHKEPFDVVSCDEASAEFAYRATAERPYLTFPHCFSVNVAYTLDDNGLRQRVRIRNESGSRMPVGLGFHTTFSLPFAAGGEIRLSLSVAEEYGRDMKSFLPDGTVLKKNDAINKLRSGEYLLGSDGISKLFKDSGEHRMVLHDTKSGVKLKYITGAEYNYWMVYKRENGDAISIEPQTWISNAPNSPFPRETNGFDSIPPYEYKEYNTRLCCEKDDERGNIK